ncbi:hypothetical protein VP01_4788g1 [Puccinia sorghi]|uniref:Uncharacterized protein n=1 Tax=Puccinia sorghi TaxID=27349 RepID=A0A0L6UMQ1_9BASI|nr:hypothetical protein VP01_4788g1 [Puccinia sorghi]
MTPEEIIDDVPEIAEAIKRNKLKFKVWWNLADMIEWQEYHLPSNTMAFIGFELGIPQERNVPVDLARLKKILENKPLAKHMKQIIETWFQDHAFSPYDNLPELHPSEIMTSWADLKTNLAVCWKQKTLYPNISLCF